MTMNHKSCTTLTGFAFLATLVLGPLTMHAQEEPAQEDAAPTTPANSPAAQAALTPLVFDSLVPAFVGKNRDALRAEASGEKPKRASQFLNDTTDILIGTTTWWACMTTTGTHSAPISRA